MKSRTFFKGDALLMADRHASFPRAGKYTVQPSTFQTEHSSREPSRRRGASHHARQAGRQKRADSDARLIARLTRMRSVDRSALATTNQWARDGEIAVEGDVERGAADTSGKNAPPIVCTSRCAVLRMMRQNRVASTGRDGFYKISFSFYIHCILY